MTVTAMVKQAAVKIAQIAASILTEAGKTAVLEHLLSQLSPPALQALSHEARKTLLQALTGTEAAPTIPIEHMKAVLRAADCLYDNAALWQQLGAQNVPDIPDAVIQEAYKRGGRVILRCSSISEKAAALGEAGWRVYFDGAEEHHYTENVSNPVWIVVQSHIDTDTLGRPKKAVVTDDEPAPTPEDWFAVIAYARLNGGPKPNQPKPNQPKGCEDAYAFTTKSGTVVGLRSLRIDVLRANYYDEHEDCHVGAARFGPRRN